MTESAPPAQVRTEQVQLRRSPKYGSFMAIGAGSGVLIGVGLAVSQPATGNYDIQQIVGFMALMLGAVGLAVGAMFALVFDRALAKRSQVVDAQRTTVTAPDYDN
ncbi:MAG: hypothetical protein ACKOXM_06865 [Agromyces sp.]